MSSSNLPRLWGLVTAACTYEGENTVLQLQVGISMTQLIFQQIAGLARPKECENSDEKYCRCSGIGGQKSGTLLGNKVLYSREF